MKRDEAKRLVEQTFKNPFSKENFDSFIRNLLQGIEPPSTSVVAGAQLPKGFEDHIVSITRLGKYVDPAGDVLDALAVKLKNPASLDRARTRQRNLMAHYLATRTKDAALVAFYSDDSPDWRFSFVRLAYETETTESGRVRPKREFTPARRFSFLVGETEPSHTAQQQLAPLLEKTERLAISDIEAAFNIETVTNEFFERYKELFLRIKDELDGQVKQNRSIQQEFERCKIDTVSFAKKLLGQIVFLYFIQKKGWLGVSGDAKWGDGDKDFLSNLFQNRGKKNYFKDVLEPFFYEALALERAGDFYKEFNCKVPFLNGGLFEPLNGYMWKSTPLDLDDKLFAEIFKICNLYNFTVREDEPLEKEVAVDPEMLGKVFENLLEVKDRRSKGAYYTPREIVHYMCQESLVYYLDATVNEKEVTVSKKDLETLVHRGDVFLENDLAKDAGRKNGEYGLPESVRNAAQEIDRALADLKICDPAIGSGAFPVGMMTEIVKVRTVLSHTPGLKGNPFRTAYDFKWHCIESSLYGVDIEPSAVEIAKLRLWLSLVVDEENYDHIRPLPNLDYRIVCGNSLLSVEKDLFNISLFSELETKKNQYFGSTSQKNKDILRKEIDLIIDQLTNGKKAFDFEVYFSEVFAANDGFDVIIANPPYIKEDVNRSAFDGTRESECYQGKMDIWYLFGCKGLDLLKQNRFLCLIATNNWISNDGASKFRNKIVEQAKILNFIDFGDFKVFAAGIQTMVTFIQKNREDDAYRLLYRQLNNPRANSTLLTDFLRSEERQENENFVIYEAGFDRRELKNEYIKFPRQDIYELLAKIKLKGKFRLYDEEIYSGIDVMQDFVSKQHLNILGEGFNVGQGIFVLDDKELSSYKWNSKEKSLIKPYYSTKEINRYKANSINRFWVIYTSPEINYQIADYPNIKKHLDRFVKIITSANKPYGLHRTRNEAIFLGEKILSVRKCAEPSFSYVPFPCYVARTFMIIKTKRMNLMCLSALLNSKLVKFWLKHQGKMQGTQFQIDKKPLLSIPLILLSAKHGELSGYVERILQSTNPSEIAELEIQIDGIVFREYGLSSNEIQLIETDLGK